MDPTLGVVHADQRNRDSFVLDAMETVRGDVDAFLLDLLQDRVFMGRDWRECMRPITVKLAQTLREALTLKGAPPRIHSASTPSQRRNRPGPERRGVSMGSVRWKPLARRSHSRPQRVTIRAAMLR